MKLLEQLSYRLNTKYLFQNKYLALFDQGIVSALNFSMGIIIGRVCAREQFGLYLIGLTIINIVRNAQSMLISTPYMINNPGLNEKDLEDYTGNSLFQQISLLLVFSVLFFASVVTLNIFHIISSDLYSLLIAISLTILFITHRDYLRHLYLARMEMKQAVLYDVTVGILQISIILTFAYTRELSAGIIIISIGIASFIGSLIWLVYKRSIFSFNYRKLRTHTLDNWMIGKWILPSGLLYSFIEGLYPWLVTFFHGTAEAGILAACLGIVSVVNPLLLGIQNYLGPNIAHVFANNDYDVRKRHIVSLLGKYIVVMLPIIALLFFFGDDLLVAAYGSNYSGYGFIVFVYSINALFRAIGFPVSRALYASYNAQQDFYATLSSFLVLLVFGIWMVMHYGVIGAVSSIAVGNFIGFLYRYFYFMYTANPKTQSA